MATPDKGSDTEWGIEGGGGAAFVRWLASASNKDVERAAGLIRERLAEQLSERHDAAKHATNAAIKRGSTTRQRQRDSSFSGSESQSDSTGSTISTTQVNAKHEYIRKRARLSDIVRADADDGVLSSGIIRTMHDPATPSTRTEQSPDMYLATLGGAHDIQLGSHPDRLPCIMLTDGHHSTLATLVPVGDAKQAMIENLRDVEAGTVLRVSQWLLFRETLPDVDAVATLELRLADWEVSERKWGGASVEAVLESIGPFPAATTMKKELQRRQRRRERARQRRERKRQKHDTDSGGKDAKQTSNGSACEPEGAAGGGELLPNGHCREGLLCARAKLLVASQPSADDDDDDYRLAAPRCVLDVYNCLPLAMAAQSNKYVTCKVHELDDLPQGKKRFILYYWYARSIFGARERMVLPQCVINFVRKEYPECIGDSDCEDGGDGDSANRNVGDDARADNASKLDRQKLIRGDERIDLTAGLDAAAGEESELSESGTE